jgi:hypothetical protein
MISIPISIWVAKKTCIRVGVIVHYNTRGAQQYIGTRRKAEPKRSEGKEKVMFKQYTNSTQMAVSAFAAVVIVSLNGAVFDQGHIASTPRGIVEVGELTLVDTTPIAAVTLPEVIVVAKRESPGSYFANATMLPEVVVIAKRAAYMVAKTGDAEKGRSAGVQGSAEGALLK